MGAGAIVPRPNSKGSSRRLIKSAAKASSQIELSYFASETFRYSSPMTAGTTTLNTMA